MSNYSRISPTIYGLRHNAKRAAGAVPGAVVYADGDGFRWGVPAEAVDEVAPKVLDRDDAAEDADPDVLAVERAAADAATSAMEAGGSEDDMGRAAVDAAEAVVDGLALAERDHALIATQRAADAQAFEGQGEPAVTYEIRGYASEADFDACRFQILLDGIEHRADAVARGKEATMDCPVVKVLSSDGEDGEILRADPGDVVVLQPPVGDAPDDALEAGMEAQREAWQEQVLLPPAPTEALPVVDGADAFTLLGWASTKAEARRLAEERAALREMGVRLVEVLPVRATTDDALLSLEEVVAINEVGRAWVVRWQEASQVDLLPASGPVTNEALAKAALDQAAVMNADSPEVAWLLRTLAARLPADGEAPAPAPRPARQARAAGGGTARVVKAPKRAMDPANPPVITSATNQGVQRLINRIAAARHDLPALRAFSFARSSTYYALAGAYLDACVAEASAAAALTE